MNQSKRIFFYLNVFLVILCFSNSVLFAEIEVIEVSNFKSDSHDLNTPSQAICITMSWSAPESEDITLSGYAYTVNTSESYTYTVDNVPDLISSTRHEGYCFENSNDIYYYAHIAPVIEIPNYPFIDVGRTSTFCPIRIDTVAPTGPTVSAPYTRTDKSTVELSLFADGSPSDMCISNSGYGNCTWKPFSISETWPLAGEKDSDTPKSVYVQFKDAAGNSVNAPILNVYYMDLSPEETQIPTLSEWGMIILSGILMMSAMVIMRRRQNQLG